MSYDALDDFAGPGGWDEGARMIGLRTLGIEWDMAACQTAKAAGHDRIRADVSVYPSHPFAGIPLYIASPPCTLFSSAGKGTGRDAIAILAAAIVRMFDGDDCREEVREVIYRDITLPARTEENEKRKPEKKWTPARVEKAARNDAFVASLVLEPARRIVEMGPESVALEQVPEVLPLWVVYARCLRALGYSVWCGVLNAANYGVPQTRERAILMGSLVRTVAPPVPTHSKDGDPGDLFGASREKWISMASALGWGATLRPSWTLCAPTSGGRNALDGGSGMRRSVAQTIERGDWVVDRKTNSKAAGGTMEPTVPVSVNRPSPTLTGKALGQWVIRMGDVRSKNGCVRDAAEPAPTLTSSMDNGNFQWIFERPATTVVGSYRPDIISAPGYRTEESRQNAEGGVKVTVAEGGVKVTVAEGGVLQSFPPAYPWQGSKTKQYQQVGNAVPPRLAAHVLAALTGREDALRDHLERAA